MTAPASSASWSRFVTANDWYRGPAVRRTGPRRHKEWQHFCILGPRVEVYVNFNVMEDQRPAALPGGQQARVIVLAREEGHGWDGDVDEYPMTRVHVRRGRVDAMFGGQLLHWDGARFAVKATMRDRPVSVDLELRPDALPFFGPNTPVGDGKIHWVVVPRLRCTGTVTVGDRVHTLQDAPGYHDHNWGDFLWGDDLSWIWGFGTPSAPDAMWNVVFVRFSNRQRSQANAQGLYIWRAGAQHRSFRERELSIGLEGWLRPATVPRFPRVMSLLSPETPTDVPGRLVFRGEGRGDRVEGSFEGDDLAQIVIPSETDLGVTIINEVAGRLRLGGVIRGEPIELDSRAVFEFLTH